MKLYPPIYQTSQGTPRDLGSLLSMKSQGFGEWPEYYMAHFGTNGHAGIDWGCREGTPIYASHDGTVETISMDSSRGEGMVLKGEDGITLYWHFSVPLVSHAGEEVKRGQKIGLSGNTGLSTGPHLHFEYRPTNESRTNGFYGAVDPTPFMVWDWLPQTSDLMTEEVVEMLYEILDINDPDGSGRKYWTGKPIAAFLKEFAKNKAAALELLIK